MKKLTTIFGTLLISGLIIISCGSDKNDNYNKSDKTKTTKKKTQLQIDAEEAGNLFGELIKIQHSMMNIENETMKMIDNGEADEIFDPIFSTKKEKWLQLESKIYDLESELIIILSNAEVYDEADNIDNIKNREKYISYFKNSAEKCRDKSEEYTYWDDYIDIFSFALLSYYDSQVLNTDNQEGWSEVEKKNEFILACTQENGWLFSAGAYCFCKLDFVMSIYNSVDEANELMTEDDIVKIAEACSFTFDL